MVRRVLDPWPSTRFGAMRIGAELAAFRGGMWHLLEPLSPHRQIAWASGPTPEVRSLAFQGCLADGTLLARTLALVCRLLLVPNGRSCQQKTLCGGGACATWSPCANNHMVPGRMSTHECRSYDSINGLLLRLSFAPLAVVLPQPNCSIGNSALSAAGFFRKRHGQRLLPELLS